MEIRREERHAGSGAAVLDELDFASQQAVHAGSYSPTGGRPPRQSITFPRRIP